MDFIFRSRHRLCNFPERGGGHDERQISRCDANLKTPWPSRLGLTVDHAEALIDFEFKVSGGKSIVPVRIFYVEGNKLIGELELEINKWQKNLGSKASVTHTSTAMTEHKDEAERCQTRLAVTIWYEL